MKKFISSPAVILATVAAFLYTSWPLSFLLNPAVGRHALASQLQASHQPYNWLFIGMDLATGLVLLAIGALQIKRSGANRLLLKGVIAYMTFGALAGVAAATPLSCDPVATSCGPLVNNPLILVHGASSIFSVSFLGLSLLVLSKLAFGHQRVSFRWLFAIVLSSWTFFGIGSLIEMVLRIHNNLMQDYFITICGLSIVLVVALIEQALTAKSDPLKSLDGYKS